MSAAEGRPPAAERRMWTTRGRERAVGSLPPEELLPDSQPSYVSSWVYVFGVAALVKVCVHLRFRASAIMRSNSAHKRGRSSRTVFQITSASTPKYS